MTKESIVEKVKKLLAIAQNDSSNDEEIDNAMRFAKKLMDNHHLTEDDLAHEPADDYQKASLAEKGIFKCFLGKKIFAWESYLASFVGKFVGAACYIDNTIQVVRKPNGFGVIDPVTELPKKGKAIVWYGVAEDCLIARDIYNELRALIATMAVGKWGNCYRGDGAAYAEGFVTGLNIRLQKAKIEEKTRVESTALILLSHRRDALVKHKIDLAKNWLAKEKGISKLRKRQVQGSKGSHDARSEGRVDGQNTDVSVVKAKKLG